MTKMSTPDSQNYKACVSDDEEFNEGTLYLTSEDSLNLPLKGDDVPSYGFTDIEDQTVTQHTQDARVEVDKSADYYMDLNRYQNWGETNYKKNSKKTRPLYTGSTHNKYPNYYETSNANDSLSSPTLNCPIAPTMPNEMLMGPPSSTSNLSYNYHRHRQQSEPSQLQNFAPARATSHPYTPFMATSQYPLQGLSHYAQPSLQQPTGHCRDDHSSPYVPSYHHHPPLIHPAAMGLSNYNDKIYYSNPSYGQRNTGPMSTNQNMFEAYPTSSHHQNMQYKAATPYAPDPMMDLLQLSNSGREARNRAEKNRRDKLNSYIQDLSGMVPHVAESPRRVDKTAVLRFAVHGLRLNHVFNKTINQLTPPPQRDTTDALMHIMDSFFLTLTCRGDILLISSSVEKHLGHCQTDLYGQNILHITHPEDYNIIKEKLIPTDIEQLFDTESDREDDEIDKKLHADKRSFTVRLARAGPRSDPTVYEVVKIDGNFRRSDEAPRGLMRSKLPTTLHMIRRSRERDETLPMHSFSSNDIVLTAIARIIHPPKIIDHMLEANKLEYKTRHLIDGRIVDCDQRISIVIGYMKNEVCNLSPFSFMHQDDARWVIVALRQMYDHHSSYGESTYRLMTRSGNFVFLHTKGFLEIDKRTNKVHSFMCVNTLLSNEEGQRRVLEMKNKFSIIIKTNIPQSSKDVPASENPQQLEKAVMCLIQNLQKSATEDESYIEEIPSTAREGEARGSKNYGRTLSTSSTSVRNGAGGSKTPPLALVPPEAESVKDSISKSVSMLNVAAAKLMRDQSRSITSPQSTLTLDSGDEASEVNSSSPYCTCHASHSCCECLSRSESHAGVSRKRPSSESEDFPLTKCRFKSEEAIEEVLTNSLDHIGRSLNRQLNAAIELRDQGNKYELPNSQQRLHEILEEHQKQNALYVNIKSEYEVELQSKSIDLIDTAVKTEPSTPTQSPEKQS